MNHTTARAQRTIEDPFQDMFSIKELEVDVSCNLAKRLECFEILYVLRGAGSLAIDNRMYTLNSNTFYCMVPGQFRSLAFDDEATGYRISIASGFLQLSIESPHYYTSEWIVPAGSELRDLVIQMSREYQMRGAMTSEIIRSLLKVFMIYLHRNFEGTRDQQAISSCDKVMIQRFFSLLQKFYASKKLVADYADELCVSPNYLNAVVKKQTGFPVSHHIRQYIIIEAKRHAMYSSLRMKEVADRLGFEDCAHFSKFFKNYSGINFTCFKKGIASL